VNLTWFPLKEHHDGDDDDDIVGVYGIGGGVGVTLRMRRVEMFLRGMRRSVPCD
jgi:hypothetical protein